MSSIFLLIGTGI